MTGDDLRFDIWVQLNYGPGKQHYAFISLDPSGPACPTLSTRNESDCDCMRFFAEVKRRKLERRIYP